jgi:oligopeptide/dipeptide ABC transporter ATP-binding protein
MPLLAVRDLVTRFDYHGQGFNVVDGISFDIEPGETVAIVGESGSGKTLTLRSIVHALPPKAAIVAGSIVYRSRDVTRPSRRELRRLRGREIGMIFQDPVAALNPVLTIGDQLIETLRQTKGMRGERAREREAIELLRLVGVPEPDRRMRSYGHELSGGMAQRVVIALALVGEPKLLLADEPTSALDVTVQAQILSLLVDLQRRFEMAILLVSHDLGVVAQTCRRVCVMYAGRIVEEAPVSALFASPRHPYTLGLLSSLPSLQATEPVQRLSAIPGAPPDLAHVPQWCRFQPRCPLATDDCLQNDVRLIPISPTRAAACIRHELVSPDNVVFGARGSRLAARAR